MDYPRNATELRMLLAVLIIIVTHAQVVHIF